MDKITLPPNGLPQEVTNIPLGQVIVLTSPKEGITAKHITMIEAVISLANKCGQRHIINTRSVEYPGLWDCYAYKVKADEVLISDKDSLFEMLCEFWGLDYEEACKTIVLDGRAKFIPYGGEKHPVRVHIKPSVSTGTEKEDYGVSLQLVQNHSRDITLGDIRSTFRDNFNFGLGISLDEVIALYKDEEKNRKSYKLDFQIKWKEIREFKNNKWLIHQKMTACDINLVDNFGNTYPIKIDAMTKAIYLTFLLFEDGIEYTQISDSDEFYDIFKQIYKKLPRAKGTPRKFNLDDKADLDTFTNYTSKTRQAILKVTNDTYAEEQFAIEGRRKDTYGIAGATAEDRDIVRKEFKIK